jgi:hypothetical protein
MTNSNVVTPNPEEMFAGMVEMGISEYKLMRVVMLIGEKVGKYGQNIITESSIMTELDGALDIAYLARDTNEINRIIDKTIEFLSL